MKVILLKDVKDLGKKDEIVNVSDGYGQNFLIPRKMAKVATEGSINEAKDKKRAQEEKKARELDNAKKLAADLSEKQVTVKAKMGENGRLFGAVSSKDISDSIKEQLGLDIDKKKIELNEPIKSQGTFEVGLKIYAGISAKMKVIVKAE